jgi:uncharacterized protein
MEEIKMILAVFAAIVVIYLAIVIFHPALSLELPLIERLIKEKEAPQCRQDVSFSVDGSAVSAWLYLPQYTKEDVPCVILSNGFGGTKDMVLEKYALQFAENGIAAIAFDYRYFGASGGQPRQFFNGVRRQEDIKAAVEFARNQQSINPDKIILWGTSSGAAYGINLAAEDQKIAGVIAQCPSLDHKKDDKLIFKREGLLFFLKLFVHAQRDKGRSRFGLSPHLIPIVGKPGTFAFMTAPGAFEGYAELAKKSKLFINGICARSLLMLQGKNPIQTAQQVNCPVLLQICEHDSTVAPDSHTQVAQILGEKATLVKYPIGHFDIYHGENFSKAVAAQVEFIKGITL